MALSLCFALQQPAAGGRRPATPRPPPAETRLFLFFWCLTGGYQPDAAAPPSASGPGESSEEELLNVGDVVELLRDFLRGKALTESEISREVGSRSTPERVAVLAGFARRYLCAPLTEVQLFPLLVPFCCLFFNDVLGGRYS